MESNDCNKLLRFLNGAFYNKEESITGFSSVGEVYKWTNEFLDIYPKDNLENKKVLTITASGDHALDAILKGATDIDCIDINIFCKYYSALKIAMIKKYDYNEFFDNMLLFLTSEFAKEKFKILNDINIYLTPLEIEFWDTYIELNEGFSSDKFFSLSFLNGKNSSYCLKDKYVELKDKIVDSNIKYYDGDLVNIGYVLDGKKYDCIYLSNILDRIRTINESEDRCVLIKNMLNHLNKKGIIYNYYFLDLYNANEDYVKELLTKDYQEIKRKIKFNYYCDLEDKSQMTLAVLEMKKR